MGNPWEKSFEKEDVKDNEKIKKAKLAAVALPLMAALHGAPVIAGEAHAEENSNNNSKKEIIQSNKEQAIAFLGKLFNMPEPKNAAAPSSGIDNRKRVAEILIKNYALERKGLSSGLMSREDISVAVNELWESAERLKKDVDPSNPGLEVLNKMHENYKNSEKLPEKN